MESKQYLSRREARGLDTLGRAYRTIEEMWGEELASNEVPGKQQWYSSANEYWSSLDPTIENVLGGIQAINAPDIKESSAFLDRVMHQVQLPQHWALDCGAGIGRVTKELLVPRFSNIDLVEQCANFVNFARDFVESVKVRGFYISGVQDFTIEPSKYELIWVQWVLSQLVDEDLTKFLQVAVRGLKPGGLLVVKENIRAEGFMVHKDDFSVTRSEKMLKEYFRQGGLRVISEQLQVEWPTDLLQIKMFALVPN